LSSGVKTVPNNEQVKLHSRRSSTLAFETDSKKLSGSGVKKYQKSFAAAKKDP